MKKSTACSAVALCALSLVSLGAEIAHGAFKMPSGVETSFKVYSSARDLHFVIRCDEPAMDQLKAEGTIHDVSVWKGDNVEIFIAPLQKSDALVQLAVSPLGAVYDAKVIQQIRNPEWNIPGLEVKSARLKDHWRLDVKIPLAALMSILPARTEQKAVTPDSWSFNLVRNRRSQRNECGSYRKCSHHLDQGNYAPLKGLKGDFAVLRWAVEALKVVSVEKAGEGVFRTVVQGTMENLTKTMREVTLQTTLSTPRKMQSFPGKKQWMLLDKNQTFTLKETLQIPACGKYQLEWIAKDQEGVLCCASEELLIRYEPMKLQIVEGAWRGRDIFRSMKSKVLAFRLVCNVPYQVEKSEQCTLTIREEKTGKILQQNVFRASDALRKVLKVKLPSEKSGRYLCAVAFSSGKIPGSSTLYEIHPPAENEIYIGSNGNFVRNGKEFFPVGSFGSWEAFAPEKEKALSHFTVVYGPTAELTPEKDRFYYENYKRSCSMFLGYPEPPALWSHPAAKGGSLRSSRPIPPENEKKIAARIRQYRGKSYIGGWYLTDEPNERVCLPDYYRKINEICHREDPYHPTFITYNAVAPAKIYGEFSDVAIIDFFPGFHEKGKQRPLDYIAPMLREASAAMNGKSLIAGPPLYAYADGSVYKARFATYREMVCMVYSSLTCEAVKGIAWNDASRLGVTADFYFGVPVLTKNLHSLEKFLLAVKTFPVQFTGKGASGIQVIGKRVKNASYILVVNPTDRKLTVQSSLLAGVKMYEILNGKKWSTKDGRLDLAPLEVCLFTDDTKAPKLIPDQEVYRQIADFQKEQIASGNYCYSLTGSDVIYSPQYTAGGKRLNNPFIRQVLTNGLYTWFLHNAPAPRVDRDPYLGIRFPEVKSVGRIQVAWVSRLAKIPVDPADVMLDGEFSEGNWKPLKVLKLVRSGKVDLTRSGKGDLICADFHIGKSQLRSFRLRFRKKHASLMSPCELKAFAE